MYAAIVRVLMVGALLVGPASMVWAQRTAATLSGVVVDPSGAVLPGARVELMNEGTGAVERQVTNVAAGEFLFNSVLAGNYTLTISMPKFKAQTVRGITLGAAQTVRTRYTLFTSTAVGAGGDGCHASESRLPIRAAL